jgi:hypothetical protein
MNDSVDQLIECARLTGVTTNQLVEGLKQIRQTAQLYLPNGEPLTCVRVLDQRDTEALDHRHPNGLPVELSQIKLGYPSATVTIQGHLDDVNDFMAQLMEEVYKNYPREPIGGLLRGDHGLPLQVMCVVESSQEEPGKVESGWSDLDLDTLGMHIPSRAIH